MNSQKLLGLAVLGALGCSAENPAAPQDPEVGATVLSIEPTTALTPTDPDGMVTLSVWPHEAGGLVSIEVCALSDGRPVAADRSFGTTCESQGGRWTIARDRDGRAWVGRSWNDGWATVRFERQAGQDPMLFRTSYEAPDGGRTHDVVGCRWLLVEGADVGVACSSEDVVRIMPWVAPGGRPPTAR